MTRPPHSGQSGQARPEPVARTTEPRTTSPNMENALTRASAAVNAKARDVGTSSSPKARQVSTCDRAGERDERSFWMRRGLVEGRDESRRAAAAWRTPAPALSWRLAFREETP